MTIQQPLTDKQHPQSVEEADNPENLCDNLDRQMTVEMRISRYSRGVIRHLYAAAREAQGGQPLSLRAAQLILEHARPGRVVLITTGAGDARFMPAGETDGPLGACALAHTVHAATGAIPIFVTEAGFTENLAATAHAARLGVRTPELALETPFATAVLPLAADESARGQGQAYLDRFAPTLMIAIEKAGPGRDGVAYRASGTPSAPTRARTEYMFDLAAERGIASLGIGDNGNEIGFGLIEDQVRVHKPQGEKLATRMKTTALVSANMSNWGAYAVCAAIAALKQSPELCHTAEQEQRMLEAGGADGSTGRHVLSVDGAPDAVQRSVVTIMECIVRNGLIRNYRRPF